MPFGHQELIALIARASSLGERIGVLSCPEEICPDPPEIKVRRARWLQNAARGDPELFARRLAMDGLDETTLGRILGRVRLVDNQTLPSWAIIFNEMLRVAEEHARNAVTSARGPDSCLNVQEPLPFEDVLIPFVDFARRQLRQRAGAACKLLCEMAHATLERALLQRLSDLCGAALQLEFSLFRSQRRSRLDQLLLSEHDPGATGLYQEFVQQLGADGFQHFFQEYAVLARLIATAVAFWIDAICEFLLRLEVDRSAIEVSFLEGGEVGPVVDIRPYLSDPHCCGRAVIAVGFACGLKLVYKPHAVGLERAFFQLQGWLNNRCASDALKVLQVLDRGSHGWCECAERLPCLTEQEAQSYFRRAGMLLCLVYALHGTDGHLENLIASGEYPVLIDLELLCCPRQKPDTNADEEQSRATTLLHNSVLTTGLLPSWLVNAIGQIVDTGGLSAIGEIRSSFRQPCWQHVNTDSMIMYHEETRGPALDNSPSLNGDLLSPRRFPEEIVDGFAQMYRLLMACRKDLLAPDGPLGAFRQQRGRWVFQRTSFYTFLLLRARQPEFLRDGADASIEFEYLSRPLLDVDGQDSQLAILRAEQQALAQQDVPLFHTVTDSDALHIPQATIQERFFAAPGWDEVLARVRNLNEADLGQQVQFIRMSLHSCNSRSARASGHRIPPADTNVEKKRHAPLRQEELVEHALALADDLRARAIYSDDGSAEWIGVTSVSPTQLNPVRLIGAGLYEGYCGVSIFLAALAQVTGDSGWHELAMAGLRPLRKRLRKHADRSDLIRELGLGAADGLGSILYSLTRISQLLKEPALLEDAQVIAAALDSQHIAGDQHLDVIGGVAGTILGLLALHQAVADSKLLESAWACGQHLANHLTPSPAGPRAWQNEEFKHFTGFSHGAAGMAYALLRLYAATGDTFQLRAAQEGMAFERSIFSVEARNWPISATSGNGDEPAEYRTAWCHGAPGIGLARLGGLKILDDAETHHEIDVALRTTQQAPLARVDHLCCGNMGCVETLLTAGGRLGRRDWMDQAHERAAAVLARASANGEFQLFDRFPAGVIPLGFFQGTAGIGYQLLRLAYSDRLPCVLLWE